MRAGRRRHKAKADPAARFQETTKENYGVPLEIYTAASRCRDEFVRQRESVTGAPGGAPGAKAWPVFCKAAQKAQDLGLAPEVFVAAVMECAATDAFFWPNALGSDRYVTQAVACLRRREIYRLGLYRSQLDRFTALLRFGSAASVLQAYGPEFSPLLRFIMAQKFNVPAVAGSSRDAARHELLIHPVAAEAFGAAIEVLR
jgi:hypothetical protein